MTGRAKTAQVVYCRATVGFSLFSAFGMDGLTDGLHAVVTILASSQSKGARPGAGRDWTHRPKAR